MNQIDLHWYDLRHEGAGRLLEGEMDLRKIQLRLGNSEIKTTQHNLNVTDHELATAARVRDAVRADAGEMIWSGDDSR